MGIFTTHYIENPINQYSKGMTCRVLNTAHIGVGNAHSGEVDEVVEGGQLSAAWLRWKAGRKV